MLDPHRFAWPIFAAAWLFAASPSAASAQAGDTTRIGAINLSYVVRMSKAGQAGLTRIDVATRQKATELEARAVELRKQEAALQQPGAALSERAQADLRRAFDKARLDFERLQQDARHDIDSMQAQFEIDFRAALAPVLDAISKEKGLQFVFGLEQAAIVWWSPAADVSEEVVKRLDAGK